MVEFILEFISRDNTKIFFFSLAVALGVGFERYSFAAFVFSYFSWTIIHAVCCVLMRKKSNEIQ